MFLSLLMLKLNIRNNFIFHNHFWYVGMLSQSTPVILSQSYPKLPLPYFMPVLRKSDIYTSNFCTANLPSVNVFYPKQNVNVIPILHVLQMLLKQITKIPKHYSKWWKTIFLNCFDINNLYSPLTTKVLVEMKHNKSNIPHHPNRKWIIRRAQYSLCSSVSRVPEIPDIPYWL